MKILHSLKLICLILIIAALFYVISVRMGGNQQVRETVKPSVVETPVLSRSDYEKQDDDVVLFGFKTEQEKFISVCVSKEKPEYIVCRLCSGNRAELEFPEDKADSFDKFTYSYYLRGGGADNYGVDFNYLSFEDEGYQYSIYQEYTAVNGGTAVGVKKTDLATGAVTDIKGVPGSVTGSLALLRDYPELSNR